MSDPARWHAYQVCRERGHSADYGVTLSIHGAVTKNHCRYCGTWFWTEHIEREEGAPIEDTECPPTSPGDP